MPELRDALRQRFGHDLSVANYATAGARADETHALVEHLLSRGSPRMLLYGITPRDLLGNEPRYARSAIYWSLGDWQQAFREDAGGALRVLPVVVLGAIGEWYYTLRYRQRPLALIEDFWRAVKLQRDGIARFTPFEILRGDVSPNPARGEWTRAQVYDTRRSLVTHPVSDAHVQLYVNGLLENGRYPLGERRVHELRARRCRRPAAPASPSSFSRRRSPLSSTATSRPACTRSSWPSCVGWRAKRTCRSTRNRSSACTSPSKTSSSSRT